MDSRYSRRRAVGPRGTVAPRIVIDGDGREVGVIVDYAQYMHLLGILSASRCRDSLPRYWRSALDGCLVTVD